MIAMVIHMMVSASSTQEWGSSSTTKEESTMKKNENHKTIGRKRRVHFANEVAIRVNDRWTKEDCLSSWYSQEEYQTMKQARVQDVKNLMKEEFGRRTDPNSYRNIVECTYSKLCQAPVLDDRRMFTRKEMDKLSKILRNEANLGLEGFACTLLSQDRQKRKKNLMELIRRSNKDGMTTLANACQKWSQPSRLWAQYFAQAIYE